jgi:hypothetical protein
VRADDAKDRRPDRLDYLIHAVRGGRLIARPLTPTAERQAIVRFAMGTLVYAATIGISFLSPGAALAIHFVVAAYYVFEQVAASSS